MKATVTAYVKGSDYASGNDAAQAVYNKIITAIPGFVNYFTLSGSSLVPIGGRYSITFTPGYTTVTKIYTVATDVYLFIHTIGGSSVQRIYTFYKYNGVYYAGDANIPMPNLGSVGDPFPILLLPLLTNVGLLEDALCLSKALVVGGQEYIINGHRYFCQSNFESANTPVLLEVG